MGFNNGYESGYDDAKAESARKIKALEARIAELETESGSLPPESSPALCLPVSPRTTVQLLAPNEGPVYDTDVVPIHRVSVGEEDSVVDPGELPAVLPTPSWRILIVPYDLGNVAIAGSTTGLMEMTGGSVYFLDCQTNEAVRVGSVNDLQNVPLTT